MVMSALRDGSSSHCGFRLSLAGTGYDLTWNSTPGRNYTVLMKNSITDPTCSR